MRNTFLFVTAATAFWVGAARADEPKKTTDEAATKDFFDGKTLDGWEGLPGFWSVKDGAIVGAYADKSLKENTFLWSKKTYKDFELHFKIRLKDGMGNSGVQIRSEIEDPEQLHGQGAAVRHRPEVLGQPVGRELRRHDEGRRLGRPSRRCSSRPTSTIMTSRSSASTSPSSSTA